VDTACLRREDLIKMEVDARIQWVLAKENGLNAARGGEKGVRGECEGTTANCSGHDNGERFVKLSCSGFRLRS